MLVAHNNILSYYDTTLNKWRCHYMFDHGKIKASKDVLHEEPDFSLAESSTGRTTLYNAPLNE